MAGAEDAALPAVEALTIADAPKEAPRPNAPAAEAVRVSDAEASAAEPANVRRVSQEPARAIWRHSAR